MGVCTNVNWLTWECIVTKVTKIETVNDLPDIEYVSDNVFK